MTLVLSASLLGLFLLAGFFAPLPYSPVHPDPLNTLQPPSWSHLFGTDGDGFDVFSRTIASASRDLPIALIGTLISLVIGIPLGLLVSKKSAWAERIMRALDVFQAFPLVIIVTAIVSLMGNSLQNVVASIVLINVPRFMRLIRAESLTIREHRFVEAAIATGCSQTRVLVKHILPNVVHIVLAQASLAVAQAVIVIAALSFVGVGISPPEPSWGIMIQSGAREMITGHWWVVVFPGLAVFAAVASFNALSGSLEELNSDSS